MEKQILFYTKHVLTRNYLRHRHLMMILSVLLFQMVFLFSCKNADSAGPPEVKKLALMNALLPGVEPVWSDFSSKAWWFGNVEKTVIC
jgi:hypothetical protein